MPYDLKPLFQHLPSRRQIVRYAKPNDPVLFVACWNPAVFPSHGEFLRYWEAYAYASVMQALIQGMPEAELDDWFVPEDDVDFSQPAAVVAPKRAEDAVVWMKRNFPTVQLPWLMRGEYTEILDEDEEMFGYLTTSGTAGYLCVFAADEL